MKRIRLTESDLHQIIKESVKRYLSEAQECKFNNNDPSYTHYAVNKKTNLIVNGWDYSDVDSSDLSMDKNYYFYDDMADYGFNKHDYAILTKKSCLRRGINPDNNEAWSNDGINPCANK